jgi:hypothetical protein
MSSTDEFEAEKMDVRLADVVLLILWTGKKEKRWR